MQLSMKSILKRLLPPPVKTFMREVNIIKDLINRQIQVTEDIKNAFPTQLAKIKDELQTLKLLSAECQDDVAELRNVMQKQNNLILEVSSLISDFNEQLATLTPIATDISQLIKEQHNRLDRLYDLFESINRENLRQYFESHSERIDIKDRYLELIQTIKTAEHNLSSMSCDHD